MGVFLADLKYGVRMLVKHPGLAIIAITALALGLGLTTTMWSITWGGILRGLPFEHAEQLLHLERARPSKGINSYAVPMSDFAAWRERQKSFEDLSAFSEGTVNVSGTEGRPERFEGGFITAATFRLLRIQPVKGRLFTDEDNQPGAAPVALLGWELWQNRFGGDAAIVGKTIRANGVTREIVGVMPRGFQFPTNAGIWLPLTVNPLAQPWGEGEQYEVMGRLRDGVTMAMAKAEFATICERLAEEHPKENEGVSPIIKPFTEEYVGEEPVLMLWTMMAAVFGVLLIACSNVANLLLARAATRTKEVAVRTALGASRWRIVSQLLTESLVLSSIGALLGTGIAWAGSRWFMHATRNIEMPFWIDIRVDGTVLAFCAGITILAALVSGVLPALQATGGNVQEILKDESRGASSLRIGRFSKGLVIAELALSGGLLVAAGFMIESVWTRTRFNYGVPTEGVFTSRVGLFESTYPDSASRQRFWNALEERLQQLPGQGGAALTTVLPGLGGWRENFALEGTTYAKEQDYPVTRQAAVSPGWFGAFGVKPVAGRVLGPGDIGGALPVAVVTEGFVRKHFGGGSAVGRRIRIGGMESKEPWLTVVGVIPDVWFDGNSTDDALRTAVLTPIGQGDYRFLSLLVIAKGDPLAMAQPVQQAVSSIDPDQPIYFVRTLAENIQLNGWFYSVFGTLFVVFGGAALFLATVGVYGVMSFSVSRRTREIGVRMALGASTRDVVGMFLRQGGLQSLIGLSAGIVLAIFLSKGLRLVLFQVNTTNWLMYAGVSVALGLTSLLATWLPARRAVGVDPNVALRYD
ncbi:MAG TPA: ABC transporter permease [Gemmatimonadales bacterium]|nr:ABC transporter permease [Gemmatimonadales bacterium]